MTANVKQFFKYNRNFYSPAKVDLILVANGKRTTDELRSEAAAIEKQRQEELHDQFHGLTSKERRNLRIAIEKGMQKNDSSHIYSKEHWGL